jgi:DNA-binding transcriptional MerR regulator
MALNYTLRYNLDMTRPDKDKWFAINGEWFEKQFSEFVMSETGLTIRTYLGNKKYKVSDTNETYRVINSWSDSGLLLGEDDRKNGWRKFSLTDMVWLQILKELRELGLGLDKLRDLKGSLFKEDRTLLFEFFIAQTIGKKDIVLIVTKNGDGSFIRETEYHNFQIITPTPTTFIVVSLNKIVAEVTGKPELKEKNESTPILINDREREIINKIAFENDLKEIVIKPKDGKINRVEFKTEKINPEQVIAEITKALKDGKRKELIIKQEDGKVVIMGRVDKT